MKRDDFFFNTFVFIGSWSKYRY